MATYGTQLTFEKEQPKEEESTSIEELVEKYMKEQENMATMSFEGQHESSPSTLGVNTREENWSYNEEITSRGNEELEKLQRVENDAETSKDLVAKEEKESTSLESYEKVKDEVVKTMPEMTLWGEMHEGLKKNEKMTPTSEVDEYIIQLNNEMKGTFVKKKKSKYKKKKFLEDYVLKLVIEHNYRFLGTDGGGHYHPFRSSMSKAGL